MSKNRVCIILPCYRVKHKIYTVYKKLISQKIDCLIFVDDNCPQKSVKYLKSRINTNKKVQFIFLRKNLGVGGATLKGFKSAFDQGYDLILKFDSDNQHKIIDLAKSVSKELGIKYEVAEGAVIDRRSYKVSFNKFYKVAKKMTPIYEVKRSLLDMKKYIKKNLKYIKQNHNNFIRLKSLENLVRKGTISKKLRVR